MPKKPRQQLRLEARQATEQARQKEFHDCDYPECPNVIGTWSLPQGYSGPIYCMLHSHIAEKN